VADLRVDVGAGLVLANPVIAASGTFGYDVEYAGVADPQTATARMRRQRNLRSRPRRATPRRAWWRRRRAMLNAIGLQNIGVESFVREKAAVARERGATVV